MKYEEDQDWLCRQIVEEAHDAIVMADGEGILRLWNKGAELVFGCNPAEAGVQITLRTTISSVNHDCLAEVTEHHSRLGAASSLFVPVRPVNSDQNFFIEELLPEPEKIIVAALELGSPGRA